MKKILGRVFAFLMVAVLIVGMLPENIMQAKAAQYDRIQLKVPYYPQKLSGGGDCGISSIAMIEAYALGYDKTQYNAVYAAVYAANKNTNFIKAAVDNGRYRQVSTNLESLYNELKNGNPILIRREPNDHWSVIVGYTGSNAQLQKSGFVVWNTARLETANYALNYNEVPKDAYLRQMDLSSWLGSDNLVSASVRGTGAIGGVSTDSIYTSIYADSISSTDATIHAALISQMDLSDEGFYISTNANMSNSKRVSEGQKVQDCKDIWYNMNKWYGTLLAGTTYYYQFYVVSGGKEIKSKVQSFTTLGKPSSPTYTSSFPLKNNAIYKITSVLSGKVMEVSTGSSQNSKQINLWTYDNSAWMQWKAVQHSDGYSFINVHTGKALDITGGSAAEGAKVAQYDYLASDAQRFKLVDKGGGKYGMIAVCSNLAVDVYGSFKTDGALLEQYSFHGGDNQLWRFEPIGDVEAPVITSFVVSDVDNTGYTVTATATDNVGVTKMPFPVKRLDQGNDEWIWYWGVRQADGSFSCRVNVSDFNSVDGIYQTHTYAYDAAGNVTFGGEIQQYVDTTPPVISDIQISNISADGYTVTCKVTDNTKVDRVQFPVWTDYNGQDDLPENWANNPAFKGVRSGNRFSFTVNTSAHNYEAGRYNNHIYAYDTAGNCAMAIADSAVIPADTKVVNELVYNGHIYQLFNEKLTWPEAKKACEDKGGHLVTITSKEEQEKVQSLLPGATACNGYFIGGYTDNGKSKWVTGEPFGYSHWISGQPDGGTGTEKETAYAMCSAAYGTAYAGWWNDIVETKPGYGYICEFDSVQVTGISLSKGSAAINKGETIQINATVTSESGYSVPVNWSSENEAVAIVEDGRITGVGAGTTKIRAECGDCKAVCIVTVSVPVAGITLDSQKKNLFKGETCQLTASLQPSDATESGTFVWTSSNPQVARVGSSGKVTANSAGTAEITVSLAGNAKLKAVCKVTVKSCVVSFETNGGTDVDSLECEMGQHLVLNKIPTKNGYAFTGWYKDAACTILWDEAKDVVNGSLTLYAGWVKGHEGLWIANIPAQHYTGKAIKPEVSVYHGNEKLVKGRDYSVKYKNNVKANTNASASNAPTVIVTGKGNYAGKESAAFIIYQKNLADQSISADDIFVMSNGKTQKPKVVVKDNKQTLKAGRDYYIQENTEYSRPGTYVLTLNGTGNYTGSRKVSYTISANSLVSQAKVSKIAAQTYTGNAITPVLTVKLNDQVLTENEDYLVSYEDNVEVGTATAIIKGIHDYSGQKKVHFKIEGISIRTAGVEGIKDMQYDGESKTQSGLTVAAQDGAYLTEGVDYTVSYKNNQNAGTASVIITGINKYAGTMRKTFQIAKYDILTDSEDLIQLADSNLRVTYEKGGARPDIAVYFDGKPLEKNKDYTLSWQKNNSVTDKSSPAVIVISGKGNFTGKVSANFQILTSNMAENVTMTMADRAYVNKKGNYRAEPILTDRNGKKLTRGKDYEKDYQYFLVKANGTEIPVEADAVLKTGSVIKVYVKGRDNYTGALSATYSITPASFTKVKVTISPKEYTGRPVTLSKSDITIKDGTTLLQGSDYEIVSYQNNVKAGTAKVVLRGVGDYGGIKTVRFKINRKRLLWWWK